MHFIKDPTTFFIGNSQGRQVKQGLGNSSHFNSWIERADGTTGDFQRFPTREKVAVRVRLRVQSFHLGKRARLKFWVQRLINRVTVHYFRDGATWRGSMTAPDPLDLPFAEENPSLETLQDIEVYQGTLQDLPGEYTVHTGYQLDDGTFLETTEPPRFEVQE